MICLSVCVRPQPIQSAQTLDKEYRECLTGKVWAWNPDFKDFFPRMKILSLQGSVKWKIQGPEWCILERSLQLLCSECGWARPQQGDIWLTGERSPHFTEKCWSGLNTSFQNCYCLGGAFKYLNGLSCFTLFFHSVMPTVQYLHHVGLLK